MKLLEEHFELFNREYFLVAKIKEHVPEQLESIKELYRESWQQWKTMMNEVFKHLGPNYSQPDNESWTNGWSIRNRFWTRFKYINKINSSSCISAMINKDNLRIYLEWHNHGSEHSSNTVKQHNQWIEYIDSWIEHQQIDTNKYRIWVSLDDDHGEYITLNNFLHGPEIREKYKKLLADSESEWIRVGRVYLKEEVVNWENTEEVIADVIKELEGIYLETQAVDINRNYWLFNVYYSQNPVVWEKCKTFEIAAMQYEVGKQQAAAVTRNLKLIKDIEVGDYVIAYTGNKGFLALGEVTKEFFIEDEEHKYIDVNGESWRQRIGVNWFQVVDEPVISSENGLKKRLGLDPSTVMSAATIFKVPKKGFTFVQQLMNKKTKSGISDKEVENVESSFIDFVHSKGFNFNEKLLKNYIISLKSKPFTILSGISGTGKTKIAQFFTEYMCPDVDVVMDAFNQEDDEFSFKYQIKPYNIKYKQLIVPQKYALLLDLPDEGTSSIVNIVFDGIVSECRLYNAANGEYRQLSFKGEISRHLNDHYQKGDYVRISFEHENDKDLITIQRIDPKKKVIKKKSDRYAFISVRPDWTDNKSLIGYYNPITEQYQVTELLKLMLRAKGKDKPYFVIFDEMNLAKVEYYFSDFLSCLESRRIGEDGVIRSESIKLHDMEPITYIDEFQNEYVIPPNLEIPENIYFTGTVNIDETTYMFSPKVLDRANVIEFNEVDLDTYLNVITSSKQKDEKISATSEFEEAFKNNGNYHLNLIKKQFIIDDLILDQYVHLKNLNSILKKYNMHFGYRVVDEILFYLSNSIETRYFELNEAMDLQILQRILPKFHGNRKKLEQPFTDIICYSFGFDLDIINNGVKLQASDYLYLDLYFKEELIENVTYDSQFKQKELIFPLTGKKVFRLLENLRNTGFASFIE